MKKQKDEIEIKNLLEKYKVSSRVQNNHLVEAVNKYENLMQDHLELEIEHEKSLFELQMKNDLILRRAEVN